MGRPRGPNTTERKAKIALRHNKLTVRQKIFIEEYCEHGDRRRAAIACGCNPPTAMMTAYKWMDAELYPLITAEISYRLARREEKAKLSSDDLLARMHLIANFSPVDYLTGSQHGTWFGSQEDIRKMPLCIKQLITECWTEETESEDGTIRRRVFVRFMDKNEALKLAAKYQLTQRVQVSHNWQDLVKAAKEAQINPSVDPIEEQIKAAALPQIEAKIISSSQEHQGNGAPNGQSS